MTLADRVVVMHAGRVEQIGPPLELYDRPQSLFVAAFIGSPTMNFMDAIVTDGGTGAVLSNGSVIQFPEGVQSPANAKVTIGVRPEHLEVGTSGWATVVSIIEPTGSETQISSKLAGQTLRILVRGRTGVRPGETVRLSVDPQNVHVFDSTTGLRL